MASRTINLALADDQMFQKGIANAVVEQHEVQFEAMDRRYVGFVTGLDKGWIRITETDPTVTGDRLRRLHIRLENVNSWGETGRTIANLDDREAEAVRAYTGLFRKAAERELAAGSTKAS